MMSLHQRRLAALIGLLFAVACSDSSGPDDDPLLPRPPTEFYGVFLDDAVAGLQFQIPGGERSATGPFGEFHADSEQPIEFFVDGISIGSVASPTTRITPNDFGVAGLNIARFLQSLDVTPAEVGINLNGLDLADTPIDFAQSSSAFAADPAVQAALAASAQAGGTGVLVSAAQASANLSAGLNSNLGAADFTSRIYYTIPADPAGESCFVRFLPNGSGVSICQDDVDADPDNAATAFAWSMDGISLMVLISEGAQLVEAITVQRLGVTGNFHAMQISSECLICDPDVEPVFELSVETFAAALALDAGDLADLSLNYTAFDLTTGTINFVANGTAGWVPNGQAGVAFDWTVDRELTDAIELRESGNPGADLQYIEMFLIQGTMSEGILAVAAGRVADLNLNGTVEDAELQTTLVYESVELLAVVE